MRTWGTIAKSLDLGTAWDVARTAMRHQGGRGALKSFGAYFSGRDMGLLAKKTMTPAMMQQFRGSASIGRAAMRIGAFGAGLGVGAYAVTRTDVGKSLARTGMAVGAGVGMYKGLKYGMSRWPAKAWGGQFMQNQLYRRGLATLGGVGTWYGMR